MSITFAILLPVTSKNSHINEIVKRLKDLAESLAGNRTNTIVPSVFLGIDKGDKPLEEFNISQIFEEVNIKSTTIIFEPSSGPPKICHFWRELAFEAYTQGADYFVLLGDDV